MSDNFHARLAKTGLVPERVKVKVWTLGEMLLKIIREKEKSVDAKPATVGVYGQAEESLYRFFGKDRQVDTITSSEAIDFCKWLEKSGRLKKPGGLALTTVGKRMQHIVSFFTEMVKNGVISCNPFIGVAKKGTIDETRNLYIEEETILKIMAHAPDTEWRLIIALWRFSGLRAFSEVLSLKWSDIDWNQKTIRVHSPKTARYPGKASREIPFFPRIEECLLEAQKEAPEGAVYVVEKHAPLYLRGQKERVYISRQGNMGTMFRKIMKQAGISPWKKLIHNLRASFAIDLMSKKYGDHNIYVIAKWMGHSVQVMLQHYGRFQKSDFAKVAEACERVRREKEQPMGVKRFILSPFYRKMRV